MPIGLNSPESARENAAGKSVGAPAPIQFFTQAATFERLWPLIAANIRQVFENGKFSHGAQVAELERRLEGYTGARHVIAVNSGTDALLLLLRACGLGHGDGVLVPAFSFVATASSVALAGGRPEFVDIDPVTYALDPDALAERIGPRSRFVMPAHLFSRMADMPALARVSAQHGLTVLEDSAEGIGMRQDGRHAGLHGAGGVLSFFPSKTLGAIGDAGAVLTDDDRIAELVAGLRHHGRFGQTLDNFPAISTETALPGINSKMDDVQAAVLMAKLCCLDDDILRRAELAEAYRERLSGVPGVIRLPQVEVASGQVFYCFVIEIERRDDLVAFLAGNGVETETYYPLPLHRQPCFADLGYAAGDFPNAEAACEHAVALPLYPDLRIEQLERVCELVRAFFGGTT